MSFDKHSLEAYSTIASVTGTNPNLTITVQTGDGAEFGNPQNVTIWPSGVQPTLSNSTIGRISGISTDTLTVTTAQEGSSNITVSAGMQIANTITPKVLTDIETNVWGIANGGTGSSTQNFVDLSSTAQVKAGDLTVPRLYLNSTAYLDGSTAGQITSNATEVILGGSTPTTNNAFVYNSSDGYFGIYNTSNSLVFGVSYQLPAPTGTSTLGGYYEGLGIGGSTAGTGKPIFGVLNSSQEASGIGHVALTVYDDNKIVTYNSTLDDGSGNMTLGGNLDVSGNVTAQSLEPVNPLGTAYGGTGSTTQNFVDLSTAQTIAGVKTFSSIPSLPAGSITASEIANATITATQIASGGIDFANLLSTIFSGQVQSAANSGTAGGTMYWINLGGIKLLWCQTVNIIGGTSPTTYTVTLPTFFTTVTVGLLTPGPNNTTNQMNAVFGGGGLTTSSLGINLWASLTTTAMPVNVLLIGT